MSNGGGVMMTCKEISREQALADAQAASAKERTRNTAYRKQTRKAAIMRARREAAAFAGYEAEAIANGDLDPRVLEIAAMDPDTLPADEG
jgi:hypothetical protein